MNPERQQQIETSQARRAEIAKQIAALSKEHDDLLGIEVQIKCEDAYERNTRIEI